MPTGAGEKQDDARKARLWEIERSLLTAGVRLVAGVDEAGRGPLAGPVVVAAVILHPDAWFCGLNDSKLVPADRREALCAEILQAAVASAIEIVPVEIIDRDNILRATHAGMRAALLALAQAPDVALIDGLPLPDCPVPQQNLVKGDRRSASIAAASILAKVTRDRIMREFDACYPGYGFARHKGYPTPEHLEALRQLGACPIHRRSFAPVQACLQGCLPGMAK